MAVFILIRHGYTNWMEKEILHGVSDPPLSDFGLQQAAATAAYLKESPPNRIFTSPLSRAVQTAEKIGQAAGVQAQPLPDLCEEDYGWLEGKRDWWREVKDHKFRSRLYIFVRAGIGAMSGEPFWQFNQRVLNTWREIKIKCKQGTTAIVAHSGVLRTILAHEFGGTRFDPQKYVLTACSVSRIETNGSHLRLLSLNENSHLPGENRL